MNDKILTILSHPLTFNLYPYGSRVYGTATEHSDFDYIAVMDKSSPFYQEQILDGEININCYSPEEFEERLKLHEISILECYFLDKDLVLKETIQFEFTLDLKQLRDNLSQKASLAFVKAKKKIIDIELYIGQKSLFHSLRILDYGIQIAQESKIKDYSSMNKFWDDIKKVSSVEEVKEYQKQYNELKSKFRLVCPK